ncbi:MAPEG family protein [Aminobacter anthyllidis]|uniref:MAPEG family protein n=1 Tax=Aminobacter anthyllidis TaxID=1035067 RepID=UPI0024572489|nr:MAPEG family protein [Aminobacter anthyllidis]MDH4985431.1 MAPEG family protein [Aminobacter anthyllidis]
MNQAAIFWPLLAQVLLVYIVYAVLSIRRRHAVRSGEARVNQFKTRTAEPESSVTAANNIINQFELPVLFYTVCLSLYVTSGVSYVALVLAWLFVATRYAHAWFHLTSNRVKFRSRAFILGALLLALLWIWFALHLAGAV